jgi:two-component system, LytTR family, response regulator
MMINCIAIDDEPLALSKLEGFISKVPELNLIQTFESGVEAISWLKLNHVDLIFLDIQMTHLTGIEFLEASGARCEIIITSAYEQYALKGYEHNVIDYLLKPYSFQRFMKSINKIMDHLSTKEPARNVLPESDKFIFVKTEYRLERVDFDEILYVEGMKDYLRIVCKNRKIMTLQSFSQLEKMVPVEGFCRVHKSFLVAINKIESVERGVIRIGSQRIPVSNTYKDNFFNLIKK